MYPSFISDDDSRVKVAGFDTDYINANYIDVRYSLNCSLLILSLLSLKQGFHKYYSRHFVITCVICFSQGYKKRNAFIASLGM